MILASYKNGKRWYDKIVTAVTNEPYSHCELIVQDEPVFDDYYLCASASLVDKGVRFKVMRLKPDHWDLDPITFPIDPNFSRSWFIQNDDKKYDLIGQLSFIFTKWRPSRERVWCSEAIARALLFDNPEQYSPGSLRDEVLRRNKQNEQLRIN